MPPRGYIAIAFALLIGLALGHWAPQSDLREARRQLAEAQRKAAGRKVTGGVAAIAGVQNILKGAENDSTPAALEPRERRGRPKPATAASDAPSAATQALARTSARTQTVARADFTNQIERIREGWVARSQIARANFVSRAELDEKQALDFDVVVEGMNLRLGTAIDQWVERVNAKGDVTPEDGVRILNEVSTALVLSYDEMDRYLPTDWRQKAGMQFELVNFADPDVLTPLQDVEGLLNKAGARSGPHRTHAFGAHPTVEADAFAP